MDFLGLLRWRGPIVKGMNGSMFISLHLVVGSYPFRDSTCRYSFLLVKRFDIEAGAWLDLSLAG
jgi:hypothetical protein